MRDCSKGRAGFDRVLMAVAATFLTVSATSALARSPIRRAPAPPNSRSTRRSRVPNPPTSRRRPPAISRSTPPRRCPMPPRRRSPIRRPSADRDRPKPSPLRPSPPKSSPLPRPSPRPTTPPTNDTATATPAAAPPATAAAPAAEPAKEPVKAASNVPPADQPVADKLREHARRQDRCAISTARPNAPRSRSSTPRANTRRCGPRPAS